MAKREVISNIKYINQDVEFFYDSEIKAFYALEYRDRKIESGNENKSDGDTKTETIREYRLDASRDWKEHPDIKTVDGVQTPREGLEIVSDRFEKANAVSIGGYDKLMLEVMKEKVAEGGGDFRSPEFSAQKSTFADIVDDFKHSDPYNGGKTYLSDYFNAISGAAEFAGFGEILHVHDPAFGGDLEKFEEAKLDLSKVRENQEFSDTSRDIEGIHINSYFKIAVNEAGNAGVGDYLMGGKSVLGIENIIPFIVDMITLSFLRVPSSGGSRFHFSNVIKFENGYANLKKGEFYDKDKNLIGTFDPSDRPRFGFLERLKVANANSGLFQSSKNIWSYFSKDGRAHRSRNIENVKRSLMMYHESLENELNALVEQKVEHGHELMTERANLDRAIEQKEGEVEKALKDYEEVKDDPKSSEGKIEKAKATLDEKQKELQDLKDTKEKLEKDNNFERKQDDPKDEDNPDNKTEEPDKGEKEDEEANEMGEAGDGKNSKELKDSIDEKEKELADVEKEYKEKLEDGKLTDDEKSEYQEKIDKLSDELKESKELEKNIEKNEAIDKVNDKIDDLEKEKQDLIDKLTSPDVSAEDKLDAVDKLTEVQAEINALKGEINDIVEGKAENQAENEVEEKVEKQTENQAENEVEEKVEKQTENQTENEVEEKVGSVESENETIEKPEKNDEIDKPTDKPHTLTEKLRPNREYAKSLEKIKEGMLELGEKIENMTPEEKLTPEGKADIDAYKVMLSNEGSVSVVDDKLSAVYKEMNMTRIEHLGKKQVKSRIENLDKYENGFVTHDRYGAAFETQNENGEDLKFRLNKEYAVERIERTYEDGKTIEFKLERPVAVSKSSFEITNNRIELKDNFFERAKFSEILVDGIETENEQEAINDLKEIIGDTDIEISDKRNDSFDILESSFDEYSVTYEDYDNQKGGEEIDKTEKTEEKDDDIDMLIEEYEGQVDLDEQQTELPSDNVDNVDHEFDNVDELTDDDQPDLTDDDIDIPDALESLEN